MSARSAAQNRVNTAWQRTEFSLHVGPLPPPEVLAAYNELVPNGADRIIKVFENQAGHRMGLERMVLWHDSIRAYLGLILGAITVLSIVAGGVFLGYNGHDKLAGVLIASDLATAAGTSVYGIETRRRERKNRAAADTPPRSK